MVTARAPTGLHGRYPALAGALTPTGFVPVYCFKLCLLLEALFIGAHRAAVLADRLIVLG